MMEGLDFLEAVSLRKLKSVEAQGHAYTFVKAELVALDTTASPPSTHLDSGISFVGKGV
jgi:hypothetical protein